MIMGSQALNRCGISMWDIDVLFTTLTSIQHQDIPLGCSYPLFQLIRFTVMEEPLVFILLLTSVKLIKSESGDPRQGVQSPLSCFKLHRKPSEGSVI